jgi:hypothetical protein
MFLEGSKFKSMAMERAESPYTVNYAGMADILMEAETSWHNLRVRMISIEHKSYIMEDRDFYLEEAEGWWNKIKEFFVTLGAKIKEFFGSVFGFLKKKVNDPRRKARIEAIMKELVASGKAGTVTDVKGFEFQNLDEAPVINMAGDMEYASDAEAIAAIVKAGIGVDVPEGADIPSLLFAHYRVIKGGDGAKPEPYELSFTYPADAIKGQTGLLQLSIRTEKIGKEQGGLEGACKAGAAAADAAMKYAKDNNDPDVEQKIQKSTRQVTGYKQMGMVGPKMVSAYIKAFSDADTQLLKQMESALKHSRSENAEDVKEVPATPGAAAAAPAPGATAKPGAPATAPAAGNAPKSAKSTPAPAPAPAAAAPTAAAAPAAAPTTAAPVANTAPGDSVTINGNVVTTTHADGTVTTQKTKNPKQAQALAKQIMDRMGSSFVGSVIDLF